MNGCWPTGAEVCARGVYVHLLALRVQFLMPMTRARESAEDETFAALETNHNAVKNLNTTFYMKRGEGPFGSLGNKPTDTKAGGAGATSFLQNKAAADTLDLELGLAQTSVPIMQMKDVGLQLGFSDSGLGFSGVSLALDWIEEPLLLFGLSQRCLSLQFLAVDPFLRFLACFCCLRGD